MLLPTTDISLEGWAGGVCFPEVYQKSKGSSAQPKVTTKELNPLGMGPFCPSPPFLMYQPWGGTHPTGARLQEKSSRMMKALEKPSEWAPGSQGHSWGYRERKETCISRAACEAVSKAAHL